MTDNPSILVVDDQADSLSLKGILASERYHVRTVDSGRLALASVGAWLPELILLDVRMPNMDGFDVCRRLKMGDKSQRVPNDAKIADARSDYCTLRFLQKPYRFSDLFAEVHEALSEPQKVVSANGPA